MGSLRVLFVTNAWPTPERPWKGIFVQRQARSLRAAGVEVGVLAVHGHRTRGEYLSAARQMARLNVSSPGYDLIHAHYGHAGVLARLQVRVPVVVSYLGPDLLGVPQANGRLTPRSRIEAQVFRNVARAVAATITKSADMALRLPQRSRARNHVIPNGVDLEAFRPRDRTRTRERLGWPVEETVILFVGQPTSPVKNFALAHEAVRLAASDHRDLRIRVACDVAPADMPLWMSASDVLLFTSRSEGSPNAIKEAMATGLPIVSSPVGDVADRVDGVPGCHVVPADAVRLANALRQAIGHGPTLQARSAIQALGEPQVAQQVIGVYERALGRA